MPRHNRKIKVRAQYASQIRETERARKRARLVHRKRDAARVFAR